MATDSLELVLLGTSSPIHTPHRFGPAQVITDGRTRLLVDVGWGSTLRLYQAGMPPQTIDGVFITHLHSDHTTDLADPRADPDIRAGRDIADGEGLPAGDGG